MEAIYRQYIFEGKVQGVFFRKTTQKYAHELGISGLVQNNLDGSVTAKLYGPLNLIEGLVEMLEIDYKIDSTKSSSIEGKPDSKEFFIIY